jgi:hypothetical protein
MTTNDAEHWARIKQHVAKQVAGADVADQVSDVSLARAVLERLDLPKEPIAWLYRRISDKAARCRETGDEQKARQLDDRAGVVWAVLRDARIADGHDARKNPTLFNNRELDRLADKSRPAKAESRAYLTRLLARRKATTPNATQ